MSSSKYVKESNVTGILSRGMGASEVDPRHADVIRSHWVLELFGNRWFPFAKTLVAWFEIGLSLAAQFLQVATDTLIMVTIVFNAS